MSTTRRLAVQKAKSEAMNDAQAALDGFATSNHIDNVLEVGCGQTTIFDFNNPIQITGIDLDEQALSANRGLDRRILGDITTHSVDANSFDVVVCWDVLEHLLDPEEAMKNMARALRPGGLLVVAAPNPLSAKGLLTKVTPYAFHRWAYRRVLKANIEPYPTYLRLTLASKRLIKVAKKQRLVLDYHRPYSSDLWFPPKVRIVYRALMTIFRFATLGLYDPGRSDNLFIFRKAEA